MIAGIAIRGKKDVRLIRMDVPPISILLGRTTFGALAMFLAHGGLCRLLQQGLSSSLDGCTL